MNALRFVKNILLLFLFLGISNSIFAQQEIKWHSWQSGIEKAKKEGLPIMVSVYNDDCSWCEHMTNTTYKNPAVIQYLSSNFVAIKLNIEEKGSLQFKSKAYNFVSKGDRSFHSLALNLMDGRYGTPAVIFVDQEEEVLQSLIGYKESKKFLAILKYYGGSYYRNIPWHTFLSQIEH